MDEKDEILATIVGDLGKWGEVIWSFFLFLGFVTEYL